MEDPYAAERQQLYNDTKELVDRLQDHFRPKIKACRTTEELATVHRAYQLEVHRQLEPLIRRQCLLPPAPIVIDSAGKLIA